MMSLPLIYSRCSIGKALSDRLLEHLVSIRSLPGFPILGMPWENIPDCMLRDLPLMELLDHFQATRLFYSKIRDGLKRDHSLVDRTSGTLRGLKKMTLFFVFYCCCFLSWGGFWFWLLVVWCRGRLFFVVFTTCRRLSSIRSGFRHPLLLLVAIILLCLCLWRWFKSSSFLIKCRVVVVSSCRSFFC